MTDSEPRLDWKVHGRDLFRGGKTPAHSAARSARQGGGDPRGPRVAGETSGAGDKPGRANDISATAFEIFSLKTGLQWVTT